MKWSKIIKDNQQEIEKVLMEAFEEAESDIGSGWGVDIEINKQGEVYHSSIISNNSQSMDSWEGNSCIITNIPCWEVDVNVLEEIENDGLTEEYRGSKYFEYDEATEFIKNVYPKKLEQWEKELKAYEIDCFKESIDERINQVIEDIERHEEAVC